MMFFDEAAVNQWILAQCALQYKCPNGQTQSVSSFCSAVFGECGGGVGAGGRRASKVRFHGIKIFSSLQRSQWSRDLSCEFGNAYVSHRFLLNQSSHPCLSLSPLYLQFYSQIPFHHEVKTRVHGHSGITCLRKGVRLSSLQEAILETCISKLKSSKHKHKILQTIFILVPRFVLSIHLFNKHFLKPHLKKKRWSSSLGSKTLVGRNDQQEIIQSLCFLAL